MVAMTTTSSLRAEVRLAHPEAAFAATQALSDMIAGPVDVDGPTLRFAARARDRGDAIVGAAVRLHREGVRVEDLVVGECYATSCTLNRAA